MCELKDVKLGRNVGRCLHKPHIPMNGRRVYHRFQHLAFSKDFWKYMNRKLDDLARRTIADPALEAHVRHELLHIFYKTAAIMKNELFGGTMTISQVFAFLDADPRDVDSLRSITHRADFMKQAIMQNSVLDGEHMEPRFGGWVMREINSFGIGKIVT